MKTAFAAFFAMLVLFAAAEAATDVMFIGFSGRETPAIEKSFTRLFQEQLATLPGVNSISNDEVLRLQSRIGHFSYPVMTSSLAATIRRCAPDTTLIVWIRAKECRIRPVRRYYFGSAIKGSLTVDFSLYHLEKQAYAYIGEVTAESYINKGPVIWFGPIEKAIDVSAQERYQLLDTLQTKATSSVGRILQTILYHERIAGSKKALPPGMEKKSVEIVPSPDGEESPYKAESGDQDASEPGEEAGPAPGQTETADTSAIRDTSGTK
jgi:hypothetical protein